MHIRPAEKRDIPRISELLTQILELHAAIRPDVFIPGTVKYTVPELEQILADPRRPVYVAADGEERVLGYAFCELREQPFSNTMVPFRSLFIDDLCVDAAGRGQGVGRLLFDHVKAEARRLGCYEITLNVWEGNDSARAFYDRLGLTPKETQLEYILGREQA